MAVGFHDVFVAAPSQKAAAEAWGTDTSVFARKEAELVTDPKLTEEPLSQPGKVIKRLRGTADEQIAALGADAEETPKAKKAATAAKPAAKAAPRPKPKPRPSRAALDEAEQAMEAAEARHREERETLAEREAELARQRKAMEAKQREERERLEARREKAENAYREAMERWRNA
jgi:type IV secretory pathway VirB10-like protein